MSEKYICSICEKEINIKKDSYYNLSFFSEELLLTEKLYHDVCWRKINQAKMAVEGMLKGIKEMTQVGTGF